MYKEGRQFVVDAKKEIDGVIKDVNQVKADAKGIIGFFKNLFSSPRQSEAVHQTTEVKPTKKVKQKAPEFDENKIYADVADALTKFFHAYNGLQTYKMEQEASALMVGDEEGQDIAIKLVIADLQMEKLNEEMREYMVYHVPPEMKNLYSRVNDMIGHIANKQQMARKAELDRKKALAWQRRQASDRLQNRILIVGAILLVITWLWISLLVMIPSTSL
jgi:uncharacterized membrane protein